MSFALMTLVGTMREASFVVTSVSGFVSFALMGHLWFKSILCVEAVYNA